MADSEYTYVLRNCKEGGVSHEGFTWPQGGLVEAPDWDPVPECGHGLHGWLEAAGDFSLGHGDGAPVWIVVKVRRDEVVDLGGKVKFPRGEVVYYGDVDGAVAYLASVGVCGYKGKATAGDRGQATAGDRGQATAGYGGQATAGYGGQATAGDRGQATAGDGGQATAGYGGQATAGDKGEISIRWWDPKTERCRVATGYVGEDGIEPNVAYEVDNGELVKVEE